MRGPCLCLRGFCLAASTTAKKQWVLREAVPDSKKEATKKGFCYWKACIQTDACRKDICWRGKKAKLHLTISLVYVTDFDAERHLIWASASP